MEKVSLQSTQLGLLLLAQVQVERTSVKCGSKSEKHQLSAWWCLHSAGNEEGLPVAAYCAKKPRNASMARRPFLTSFTLYSCNVWSSPREKPRGSKNGPPTCNDTQLRNQIQYASHKALVLSVCLLFQMSVGKHWVHALHSAACSH